MKKLLPEYANGELAAVCSWPDEIKRLPQWRWTSGLHFADTPDYKCNYEYSSGFCFSFPSSFIHVFCFDYWHKCYVSSFVLSVKGTVLKTGV